MQNPREYGYPEGVTVEIEGAILTDMIMLLESLMQDEVKSESKFKYDYINDKGKVLKSPKKEDIESGKVRKVVNFQRTVLEPTMEMSITQKGLAYAERKHFLEGLHYQNIQEGVAKHYSELQSPVEPVDTEIKQES